MKLFLSQMIVFIVEIVIESVVVVYMECAVEHDDAFLCGGCEERFCETCSEVDVCGICFNLYCPECAHFKPGIGGRNECYNCQTPAKRRRRATDYCSACGSTDDGNICRKCKVKVCEFCPGFHCAGDCGKFYCEDCQKLTFCDDCEELFCKKCDERVDRHNCASELSSSEA